MISMLVSPQPLPTVVPQAFRSPTHPAIFIVEETLIEKCMRVFQNALIEIVKCIEEIYKSAHNFCIAIAREAEEARLRAEAAQLRVELEKTKQVEKERKEKEQTAVDRLLKMISQEIEASRFPQTTTFIDCLVSQLEVVASLLNESDIQLLFPVDKEKPSETTDPLYEELSDMTGSIYEALYDFAILRLAINTKTTYDGSVQVTNQGGAVAVVPPKEAIGSILVTIRDNYKSLYARIEESLQKKAPPGTEDVQFYVLKELGWSTPAIQLVKKLTHRDHLLSGVALRPEIQKLVNDIGLLRRDVECSATQCQDPLLKQRVSKLFGMS